MENEKLLSIVRIQIREKSYFDTYCQTHDESTISARQKYSITLRSFKIPPKNSPTKKKTPLLTITIQRQNPSTTPTHSRQKKKKNRAIFFKVCQKSQICNIDRDTTSIRPKHRSQALLGVSEAHSPSRSPSRAFVGLSHLRTN